MAEESGHASPPPRGEAGYAVLHITTISLQVSSCAALKLRDSSSCFASLKHRAFFAIDNRQMARLFSKERLQLLLQLVSSVSRLRKLTLYGEVWDLMPA